MDPYFWEICLCYIISIAGFVEDRWWSKSSLW